jgi:hypothetical protein
MSQSFSSNQIATGDPRNNRRPRLMFDFEDVIKKTSRQTVTCIGELLLDDLDYSKTSRNSAEAATRVIDPASTDGPVRSR